MADAITLDACRPAPLASYLKALGILRLLAEQADDTAAGFWRDERFHLHTNLDSEALRRFFLESYEPTPIIAPWNGGSGFYPKDNKEAFNALASSTASRFAPYKQAITLGMRLIEERKLTERPTDEAKRELIEALRSNANDAAVGWMDAAVALTSEDKLAFPPLLGTGGNDGRLDFTNNLMQRLTELIDPVSGRPQSHTLPLLNDALFSEPAIGLANVAIGQFSPGAAGGPNGSTGYDSDGCVNPWDFILMLEGALAFAGGVSRRLESADASFLSSPFTFRATGAGFGTASLEEQEEARGEIWAPLWPRPARLSEVRALFREGRLSLGTRRVKDGLDAARAAAALGANRGIAAFERYGFVKRQGLAYLAVPLGRRRVAPNPTSELASDLYAHGWLDRVRREATVNTTPPELRAAVRTMEDTLFEAAGARTDRIDPRVVQTILIALGTIVRIVSQRPKLWEQLPTPPKLLHPSWMSKADDGTPEFRIAAALAGLHARERIEKESLETAQDEDSVFKCLLPMRSNLAPLDPEKAGVWDATEKHIAVWGNGNLIDNLCAVLQRRLIDAGKRDLKDKPLHSLSGARHEDIVTFFSGSTNDRRIADLLAGLAWVTPTSFNDYAYARLPLPYAALKPLFTPDTVLNKIQDTQKQPLLPKQTTLPIPSELPNILMTGRTNDAIQCALKRVRASGLPTPFLSGARIASACSGRRLLAALAIPVHISVARDCLYQAYIEKETDDARSEAS